MIICGYAGIGKSYLGHNAVGVIDLESTPFEKDWERYAKCAISYYKQIKIKNENILNYHIISINYMPTFSSYKPRRKNEEKKRNESKIH